MSELLAERRARERARREARLWAAHAGGASGIPMPVAEHRRGFRSGGGSPATLIVPGTSADAALGHTVTLATSGVTSTGKVTGWTVVRGEGFNVTTPDPLVEVEGYYDVHVEVESNGGPIRGLTVSATIGETAADGPVGFCTGWRGVLPHLLGVPGDPVTVDLGWIGSADVDVRMTVGLIEPIPSEPTVEWDINTDSYLPWSGVTESAALGDETITVAITADAVVAGAFAMPTAWYRLPVGAEVPEVTLLEWTNMTTPSQLGVWVVDGELARYVLYVWVANFIETDVDASMTTSADRTSNTSLGIALWGFPNKRIAHGNPGLHRYNEMTFDVVTEVTFRPSNTAVTQPFQVEVPFREFGATIMSAGTMSRTAAGGTTFGIGSPSNPWDLDPSIEDFKATLSGNWRGSGVASKGQSGEARSEFAAISGDRETFTAMLIGTGIREDL